MGKDKWFWMPHTGHFILGHRCRFHLNTYVNGYIISTVGELWNDRIIREIHAGIYDPQWLLKNEHLKGDYFDTAYFNKFGFEEIACGIKYETMVFSAEKSTVQCCPYIISAGSDIDLAGYNDAGEAYKGHLRLCKQYDKK